jgi:hypothetical protein
VIGERVYFTVTGSSNKSQSAADQSNMPREYGQLRLLSDGTDLATYMVASGWAKVKKDKDGNVHQERQHLKELEEEASAHGLGMFSKLLSPESHVRNCNYQPLLRTLFDNNQNFAIPAIVEQVRERVCVCVCE